VGPIAESVVWARYWPQRSTGWHRDRFGAPVSASTVTTALGELPFAPSPARMALIRADPALAALLASGMPASWVSYFGEMVCAYPRDRLVRGDLDTCHIWR